MKLRPKPTGEKLGSERETTSQVKAHQGQTRMAQTTQRHRKTRWAQWEWAQGAPKEQGKWLPKCQGPSPAGEPGRKNSANLDHRPGNQAQAKQAHIDVANSKQQPICNPWKPGVAAAEANLRAKGLQEENPPKESTPQQAKKPKQGSTGNREQTEAKKLKVGPGPCEGKEATESSPADSRHDDEEMSQRPQPQTSSQCQELMDADTTGCSGTQSQQSTVASSTHPGKGNDPRQVHNQCNPGMQR